MKKIYQRIYPMSGEMREKVHESSSRMSPFGLMYSGEGILFSIESIELMRRSVDS